MRKLLQDVKVIHPYSKLHYFDTLFHVKNNFILSPVVFECTDLFTYLFLVIQCTVTPALKGTYA